jgi:hypothetical protein
MELAPKICPVCDLQYDTRWDDVETGRVTYLHPHLLQMCVKDPMTGEEVLGIGDG